IDRAGFYHLRGKNGSGKTTLLEAIMGVHTNMGIQHRPASERISAYFLMLRYLPVTFQLLITAARSDSWLQPIYDDLCLRLGVSDKLLAKPANCMSAGELQRCGILLTLLKNAEMYIFD